MRTGRRGYAGKYSGKPIVRAKLINILEQLTKTAAVDGLQQPVELS